MWLKIRVSNGHPRRRTREIDAAIGQRLSGAPPVPHVVPARVLHAGTTDDKYLYPGFAQAVDSNQADGPDGTERLWPEPDRPKTWVGAARHHILRIDQSGRDVAIVGCVYSYSSAEKTDAGSEANIGGTGPDAGISAIRIGLQAPANNADLPAQGAPSRAPYENVFGGWKVTNHQGGYLATAEWPDHAKDVEQCVAQAPEPPEARTFIPTSPYPQSDFPTIPATPGWPAG